MADTNTGTDRKTEKQKVQEITDKLEQGLQELFDSEKYKNYLSTMSKFHHYSFNNTMLIAMQKPDATLVAGFQAWKKNFERHVNMGERGIKILAPAPYKIKEERDKEDPITGKPILDELGMPQKEEVEVTIPAFRVVTVFDVSQTDGKPIPELEAKELMASVERYEDFVKAITFVAPVPIGFEDIPGNSKGFYHLTDKRIAIQEGMSESQTLKTMIHEVAHSILHAKDVNNKDMAEQPKDSRTKEVEAESVAYTVCQHFGIDTSDYSFGYIAGWSSGKDMKELKSSLDTIRKTASELIDGIEHQLRELEKEREAEQTQDVILLIHNNDQSKFELLDVSGMDKAGIESALASMSDNDRADISAYLESKGAWVTKITDEQTREVREYHLDMRYNRDSHEITILDKEQESSLSPMEQAEQIINELEKEKTAFTNEERNLIVNYAYQTGDVEKTRELAENLYQQELSGDPKVAQTIWNAKAEIDSISNTADSVPEVPNTFQIYQLKDDPELRNIRFMGTDALKQLGLTDDSLSVIKPENYNLVYEGDLAEFEKIAKSATLEMIYTKFNVERPEDFKGHSLSVSDIVVLHRDGEHTANYVDSFGFREIPEFLKALELTSGHNVQKSEEKELDAVEITYTVAECSEFHNYGEYYENIPTAEDAIKLWREIPPDRLNAIPAIGINVHRPGEEEYKGDAIDIVSGNRIGIDILKYIPAIADEPKAMEAVAMLIAKLPDLEIYGIMSPELEAKVWEIKKPDLDLEGQLALEYDRLLYDYYSPETYDDTIRSMTENVEEITEQIRQGDTGHIADWHEKVAEEGAVPEKAQRAKELLAKLTEYKPLAKVEELEEQNYNMIDNVLNNGCEKFNKEQEKREQEKPPQKPSLRERLAEKKAEAAGQGRGEQEAAKKNQREM